jgi:hypothetical protein
LELVEFVECYWDSSVLVEPFTEFGEQFVDGAAFAWCWVSELDQ